MCGEVVVALMSVESEYIVTSENWFCLKIPRTGVRTHRTLDLYLSGTLTVASTYGRAQLSVDWEVINSEDLRGCIPHVHVRLMKSHCNGCSKPMKMKMKVLFF